MDESYLTVYGHTNLDYIMSLRQFPPKNTSVDILDKKRYFGGTAANVATLSAALGVPTSLASFVGPDFPLDFRSVIFEKGVNLKDLVTVQGYETPTVWIISDEEHNQIAFVYQGPMGAMDDQPLRMNRALISETVHIMTGRPNYYLRLMAELKAKRKRIAFDPSQEIHHVWDHDTFRKAMGQVDSFFCNENELSTALRYLGLKEPSDLLQYIPIVVQTKGAKGSVIYTSEGKEEVPIVPSDKVVDTTGCGDAFRAGFYAGQYRRRKLRDCAVLGAAAASFVIESRGALTNIPDWEKVLERAEPLL